MKFKNMLNESAMKLAFGYHKDGSTVLVAKLKRKKSNATRRRMGKTIGRQGKGRTFRD